MNRREWMQAGGAAALGTLSAPYAWTLPGPEAKLDCVFQLSVITDEISQDFGHAVEVAANEFGVGFVELRGLWNKNVVNLEAKDVAEAQNLLKKYDLKVTDIASPLFKVDWPGAPKSKYSPKGTSYGASFSLDGQRTNGGIDHRSPLFAHFTLQRGAIGALFPRASPQGVGPRPEVRSFALQNLR